MRRSILSFVLLKEVWKFEGHFQTNDLSVKPVCSFNSFAFVIVSLCTCHMGGFHTDEQHCWPTRWCSAWTCIWAELQHAMHWTVIHPRHSKGSWLVPRSRSQQQEEDNTCGQKHTRMYPIMTFGQHSSLFSKHHDGQIKSLQDLPRFSIWLSTRVCAIFW